MGILHLLIKAIQILIKAFQNKGIEPVKEEYVIPKNINTPRARKLMSDEEFNSKQFRLEILSVASAKYTEYNHDYLAVRKYITEIKDVNLTEEQVDKVIEVLKRWNDHENKKDRFGKLVSQAQILVNEGQKVKAFELVYEAYAEDHSDIDLVELMTQLADMFSTEESVLEIYDKLTGINPDDAYNIKYRKGLYLQAKGRFNEAIDLFEKQNIELQFAWNYYQIAIIQNILGKTELCLDNLQLTFELDPDLKQDAKNFPKLQNLQQHPRFLALIA